MINRLKQDLPIKSSGPTLGEGKNLSQKDATRFKEQAGREKGPSEFEERVIEINRTSKKTKGGNRFAFSALVVVGNRQGLLGIGLGKANVVSEAVKKAIRKAKLRLFSIELVGAGKTLAHPILLEKGAVKILLKPAPAGTGVRVGGPLRAIFEVAGVRNITGRLLGSRNKKGITYNTIEGLKSLKKSQMRIKTNL